ncbi:hypothetical protein CGCVW01_v000430 [Colletotrichum viniferum]|nr:hypothetical protein CGCVW01_v000430 [Colletotrichum viniferum]
MESHLCIVSKDVDGFGRLHVHVSVGGNTSRCMSSLSIPTLPPPPPPPPRRNTSKHTHTHSLTHSLTQAIQFRPARP